MRKQYIHHGTTSHFGLGPFLTKVFFLILFYFLLSLGFYRVQMWCNCHLHSSSHQRILTDNKVTEAVIDDLEGRFFILFIFFSGDGAQMLPFREQDVSNVQERTFEIQSGGSKPVHLTRHNRFF